MGDWKKIRTSVDPVDAVVEAATVGLVPAPTKFTFENKETGERRDVTAFSEKRAGEKISDGSFDK